MEGSSQDEEFIIPLKYTDLTEQVDDLRRYTVDRPSEFETTADVSQTIIQVEGFYYSTPSIKHALYCLTYLFLLSSSLMP